MAPLSARSDPTNPVSPAQHEASLWLGGLALVATGLMVTATARRLGAGGWGVQFAVLAFVFGAGLFSYSTCLASFVHVHVAMFAALLVWSGVRVQQEGRSRRTTVVAVPGGFFIVAMRNINLFIIIVLVAFYVGWAWRAGTGIVRARALEGVALVARQLEVPEGIAVDRDLRGVSRRTHGDLRVLGRLGNRRWAGFGHRGFIDAAPVGMLVTALVFTQPSGH